LILIDIANPDESTINELKGLTKELVEGLGQEFEPKRFDWGISRRLYDPLQRHGILVAKEEDSGRIIGMCVAELKVDPFGTSEGYIKQVFVKTEYRGKGIGKGLLERALEHLKKIKVDKVKVNIKEQAKEAGKLYEQMKFKKVYEVLEIDLREDNT